MFVIFRSGFVIYWDSVYSSTKLEGFYQLSITLYKGIEKLSQTEIPFNKHNVSFNHVDKEYTIGVKQSFPK